MFRHVHDFHCIDISQIALPSYSRRPDTLKVS